MQRYFNWYGRVGPAIAVIASLAFLTGCSSVRKPTASEGRAVNGGDQSLIFLRVFPSASTNGKSLKTLEPRTTVWRLDDADGKLEPVPPRESLSWLALDKESGDEG